MAGKSVQAMLEDIRLLGEEPFKTVEGVRKLVKSTFKDHSEEVKYGGILFAVDGVSFGGVFAYAQHVSVEFSKGAAIRDALGHLEGVGKGRRHLKLLSVKDIKAKALATYLPLALEAAKRAV